MRCLLILLIGFLLSCSTRSQDKEHGNTSTEITEVLSKEKPYVELKKEALEKREAFRIAYNSSKSKQEKDSIQDEAHTYLLNVSDEFFSAWYGSPWTFHGHSQNPKQGSIACGYFVTTTLRDMGFNIPRIKWAQQASEYVIKKLSQDISRFYNKPMTDIISYIESKGEGLYIVGLDCHVGYIYYRNEKMSFVHANYYRPKIGVMSEPLIGRNPLNDSKYRVVGKIFDREMILNWIQNTSYSE